MAITFPEVAIRLRINVLDPIIAPACRPSRLNQELKSNPCLGFTTNGVNGLARRLREEFAAENLQLTPHEISKMGPTTVDQLAGSVYQRVRFYSDQVTNRVIATIKGMLSDPTTTVKAGTVVVGDGLNLSRSAVAQALHTSFFPLIRLNLRSSDIRDGFRVSDIASVIIPQFTALGR